MRISSNTYANELAKQTASPGLWARKVSNGRWKMPRHLAYLDRQITKAIKKGNQRIIVTMPPRHGKSEYLSKYVPAWHVGKYPKKKVMIASYTENLAAEFSLAARDLIKEHGIEDFNIYLDEGSRAKAHWKVKHHGGGMSASGVGGGMTGKGADLLIIDDPVKNDLEAASPTIREQHEQWFQSTALTRLAPNATVIIIMTRWHKDDLVGRVLKGEDAERWQVIRLPAICDTEDDPLGRKFGEPLWPKQWTVERLMEFVLLTFRQRHSSSR